MSIIGDSFVYDLGREMIVITSTDYAVRSFLANINEGRRAEKLLITLVPEQRSLYNARFNAFHLRHLPLLKQPESHI